MIRQHHRKNDDHDSTIDPMREAMLEGVREALRRHMLLGEPVAVSDGEGRVQILTPDDIRKALDDPPSTAA